MFSILLLTARCILNSLICVVHFSNDLNSVFHIKGSGTYWCSSSVACLETRRDWILRILTFNDKNPLNFCIISKLQIFEGQSEQGVTQLVIKPFGIS